MEQITKRGTEYWYGEQRCKDADDCYKRFREGLYAKLGKSVYRHLNVKYRQERIHGFHAYYTDAFKQSLEREFGNDSQRVPVFILGLSGISYTYAFNLEDCPDYEEEKFYRWIDWALLNYGTVLKLKGRKSGRGRTSKRLKTKFR